LQCVAQVKPFADKFQRQDLPFWRQAATAAKSVRRKAAALAFACLPQWRPERDGSLRGKRHLEMETGMTTKKGTTGVDFLTGSSKADKIYGDEGNDSIWGMSGSDLLYGDAGNDAVHGGGGSDIIYGGDGNDSLNGDTGTDTLIGGAGADKAWGGTGNDVLTGDLGDDYLFGESGNDWLDGGEGDDQMKGGSGDDRLMGGEGDDIMRGEAGDDTFIGGAGNDTFYFGSGTNTSRDAHGDDDYYIAKGSTNIISDNDGKDVLHIGFAKYASLMFVRQGDNLEISFSGSDGVTEITGFFADDHDIETIIDKAGKSHSTSGFSSHDSGDIW